jgi:pyruvate dehydrogenase E1 component alpha subunit
VEALTYRMGPHTTSDDPSRYRSLEDEAPWAQRDPLALARAALEADGLADQAFFEEADAAGARLAAAARERCGSLQAPPLEDFFGWVYGSANRLVAEELAAWRASGGAAEREPAAAGAAR